MDHKPAKRFQGQADFSTTTRRESAKLLEEEDNPFVGIGDPLCKLNLKETSEFVKSSFPTNSTTTTNTKSSSSSSSSSSSALRRGESSVSVGFVGQRQGQRRFLEVPSTPGRPVFGFSAARKSIPSKWDDAEKWLISTASSPAHPLVEQQPRVLSCAQIDGCEVFDENLRVTREKVVSQALHQGLPSEVLLEDKFTEKVKLVFPNYGYTEGPAKEGFMFSQPYNIKYADLEVYRRDIGTEMTPMGSSTASPIKTSSPARHNTPADRSGPLLASASNAIDISELKDCHFAKLELSAQYDAMDSNWSTREEEEEEISKSLRHFEMGGARKSFAESRASAWEEEERAKTCIRYQRQEARIQAWLNLEGAKAEAQSRKLEVKIQKMRSELEEKLMKRMAAVHRKAGEWRAAARLQHSQQKRRASSQEAQKIRNNHKNICGSSDINTSCGCFSCNTAAGELL